MKSKIKQIIISFFKNPLVFLKLHWYTLYVMKTRKYRDWVLNSPQKAIDIVWYVTYQKNFPWDNPETLNEKITWLSGKTDTTKWTECSDKYEVRNYIKGIGLEEILTKCYGVWDDVDEIDFDKLPKSFVLKCTHDCGSTILVKDKDTINVEEVKTFLRDHLKYKMGYDTCEPHYARIKPRIMAEELLDDSGSGLFESKSIVDYKLWCINDVLQWGFICYDRHLDSQGEDPNGHSTVFDLYDVRNWKPIRQYLSEEYKHVTFKDVPCPKNLEGMIQIAERIAKGFPQVRVDLYNLNGKIYFGEMTFTSQGGRMSYYTDEFQKIMGKKILLLP